VETSVVLPGANNILGLWPAVWTMGNLGRAGYGASLEGMWPYTYGMYNATSRNMLLTCFMQIPATLEQWPISPSMGFPPQQQSMVIGERVVVCPSSQGRDYHGVHAQGKIILGRGTLMGHLSVDLLLRSTCSRHRYEIYTPFVPVLIPM
jgi:hypothetical protein